METVIEIRPIAGTPFTCRAVGVELRTEQRVQTSSSFGSSDVFKEYKVCGDPAVYSPPIGNFYQELLALDIPVVLPIPHDTPPSGYFDNWGATTVHHLYVKFTGGTSSQSEYSFLESFAIPIKLYDTLPLYRQFNEKVVEPHISSDNQLVVDITLPVSAFGPSDPFAVAIDVRANPSHNKRKRNLELTLLTLQMREVLECYDGGLPARKDNKFLSTSVNFGKKLTTEGFRHEFRFPFPHDNDALVFFREKRRNYTNEVVSAPTALFNKNKNYQKLAEGVPLTHVQGFTLNGKLYSLRYEITVKVKINHGKDIEVTLPITVSPFDRESSEYLLLWIKSECLLARDKYGRDTVGQITHLHNLGDIQQILNHFCAAPHVYFYTKEDWGYLGYDTRAFRRQDGRPLVTHID